MMLRRLWSIDAVRTVTPALLVVLALVAWSALLERATDDAVPMPVPATNAPAGGLNLMADWRVSGAGDAGGDHRCTGTTWWARLAAAALADDPAGEAGPAARARAEARAFARLARRSRRLGATADAETA